MTELYLGEINGHAVGRILKEAVRRATATIRAERAAFEVYNKEGYDGRMDDVFTTADRKAQEIYLRTITECFPHCGVVAEEDALRIEPKGKVTAYFTVDPLDGTKAFIRGQSHGVGTMIALVQDNEVISAYIGDINTQETYGYRPGSNHVHRITHLDSFQRLDYNAPFAREKSYVMLRDSERTYSHAAQQIIDQFHGVEVSGGSIGIWMARLWKREVAAAILPPSWETPWDSTPIIGISKKLGYKFLRAADNVYNTRRENWVECDVELPVTKYERDYDLLVVHADDVAHITRRVSVED